MPRIGELLGVFFYLYYLDHGLIHVHAIYQDHVAVIALDGTVLEGKLPAKKLKIARKFVTDNMETIQALADEVAESKAGTGPAPKAESLTKKRKKP
jgi:hypothetical protein